MTTDYSLGLAAYERYGFSGKLDCCQFAYYGEKPEDGSGLSFWTADERDFTML